MAQRSAAVAAAITRPAVFVVAALATLRALVTGSAVAVIALLLHAATTAITSLIAVSAAVPDASGETEQGDYCAGDGEASCVVHGDCVRCVDGAWMVRRGWAQDGCRSVR
jgi:hypothetical protein